MKQIQIQTCVELICCIIDSAYSLKATLECVLGMGFL